MLKLGKSCKEGRNGEGETEQELHRTRRTESSGTTSVHSGHGSLLRCLTDYDVPPPVGTGLACDVGTQERAKPCSVRVSR